MRILKFQELNKLNENTELQWNMTGGNPTMPGNNSTMDNVVDYNLSVDGYDRFALSQQGMVKRLNNMMGNFFDQGPIMELEVENLDELKHLKVLRIIKNNEGNLNIFITFEMDDTEYYGVFWNYGGMMPPKFVSEIQKMNGYIAKDKFARLQGILLRTIEKWFEDLSDSYVLINDQQMAYDYMGNGYVIKKGTKVLYLDSNLNPNHRYIKIRVKIDRKNVKDLYLKGLDVFFFKYWFEPLDKSTNLENL